MNPNFGSICPKDVSGGLPTLAILPLPLLHELVDLVPVFLLGTEVHHGSARG